MPKYSNKISRLLILSEEDNEILLTASQEAGLKVSEFLRAIIQGIGVANQVAKQIESGKDVKVEFYGHGLSIPKDVINEVLINISDKLFRATEITKLEPTTSVRSKRIKTRKKVV